MKSLLGLTLFVTAECLAVTLRVPQDYGSIQAALDVVADGDTVLVDVGTYAEALITPPYSFVLRGNVSADTGEYARPVINPAPLPGSDSLSCMIISAESQPIVEDIKFFNGAEMYPRLGGGYYPGGIWNYSELPLVLRRCVFDSVWDGFLYGLGHGNPPVRNRTTVDRCEFINMTRACGSSKGPLTVRDCLFHGNNQMGIGGRDSVLIERCRFTGHIGTAWVGLYGVDDTLRDCVFGPGDCGSAVFEDEIRGGGHLIEGNTIDSVGIAQSVAHLSFYSAGPPLMFRDNSFTRLYPVPPMQIHTVTFSLATGAVDSGMSFVIEGNTFADYELGQGYGWPKAFSLDGECSVRWNRFANLLPTSDPAIVPDDSAADRVHFSENVFLNNGVAISSPDLDHTLDARFNYWGAASGPYHADTNPNGAGDAVLGNIQFVPWYPDTSFLGVSRQRATPPAQIAISVYPNPFNAVATISFVVPHAGGVSVKVFDLTGRLVNTLCEGRREAGERAVGFEGKGLSSGVYLVRVQVGEAERVAKMVLLK